MDITLNKPFIEWRSSVKYFDFKKKEGENGSVNGQRNYYNEWSEAGVYLIPNKEGREIYSIPVRSVKFQESQIEDVTKLKNWLDVRDFKDVKRYNESKIKINDLTPKKKNVKTTYRRVVDKVDDLLTDGVVKIGDLVWMTSLKISLIMRKYRNLKQYELWNKKQFESKFSEETLLRMSMMVEDSDRIIDIQKKFNGLSYHYSQKLKGMRQNMDKGLRLKLAQRLIWG